MIPSNRITPFAKEILNFYPLPTTSAERGNNFFSTVGDISDNNQLVARIDHTLGGKTALSFRYYFFDGVDTNRSPIQNSGENNDVRNQNVAFSATHSFSPSTLYELRLGYNRPGYFILQDGAYDIDYASKLGIKNLLNDPIVWGIPSVGLTNFSGIGVVANPNAQLSNVYQIVNHVSLVRAAHNVKFGADLRKTNYNDRGERNARGAFNFSGALTADPQRRANTGVAVADLLLGLPLNAQGGLTSLAGNFNAFHYYFFIQDDWKISSRLTLNLGLRYELNTRFVEVQDRQSFFDRSYPGGRLLLAGTSQAFVPPNTLIDAPPTPRGLFDADKNNWSPRVGMAFRPFGNNRTAIRMGYGIFYTMVDGQATRQLERNPPRSTVVDISANQDANSNAPDALRVGDLFPAQGTLASRPQVWTDIGYRPEPYVQQWNLSLQQALTGSMLVELGYIGSKGTRMVFYSQGNQAVLDSDPSRPTPLVSRQPFPRWGSTIRTAHTDGNSTYHAGFIKLERRLSKGFSLLTHYTFSKSLDLNSDINEAVADFYNFRRDKGRGLSDIRHRAVIAATWDFPFGRGKRFLSSGPLSLVLGDWKSNTIVSMRGGFPFSATVSGDVCNCAANAQRAEQAGDPRSGFEQSREKWFNTAAFVRPATDTFGNSGRNILDGPGEATVSFSLFRVIPLNEKARLQIRSEFFNLFNRVNFGNPGSTVGTTSYGVINSAGDARIIQFALKFEF